MLKYFITPKEQQKLDLIQAIILSVNGKSKKDLADQFQIKNETLRRYINELQNDLFILFDNNVALIENSKKELKIKRTENLTIDYIITFLRISYMKESSLYRVLSAIIEKKYSTISEIAYELHFSDATVYKTLATLNELLIPFNANFSFNKGSNFDGDEIGVRYFLYLTYWHFFNSLNTNPFPTKLPSEFINIDYLKTNLGINKKLSKTQESKLIMLAGITSYRIVICKKYADLSKDFLSDLAIFYNEKSYLNLDNFDVPYNVLENESKLFGFLARGIIADLDSFETKESIINKFISHNRQTANKITKFLDQFSESLDLKYKKNNYIESYYLLIFSYLYFKYTRYNVDHYYGVPIIESFKTEKKYQQIEIKLKSLVNKFPFEDSLNANETDTFMYLLFIIHELNYQITPIKIYVSHASNLPNAMYIKKKLTNFFSHNIITFSDSPGEAEIIISSSSEGYFNSKYYFYLENIFDQDTWKKLIDFLSDYLYNKKIR
ncbi:TPA: helix-turn-helix domain-containing protein [Listeria monocytogenes]